MPSEKAVNMYLEEDPSLNMLIGDVERVVLIFLFWNYCIIMVVY